MTPLEIEMLLHFHGHSSPWDSWFSAQNEALDRFKAEGLVATPCNKDGRIFLSDRGEAYVKFLMAMPLPVCTWKISQDGWNRVINKPSL